MLDTSRSTFARALASALSLGAMALTTALACSTPSPSIGKCSPSPVLSASCENCVATACGVSVDSECNAQGDFSSCYCMCTADGGTSPDTCTQRCVSAACGSQGGTLKASMCVIGSLEGACAVACGLPAIEGGARDAARDVHSATEGGDATVDGGADGSRDATLEGGHDSGGDTGRDSGVDARKETSTDSGHDSGGPEPASCAPGGNGLVNCGSAAESCCRSLEITGGRFDRTYDTGGDGGLVLAADGGPTGLADPATVSGFRLDKYEVTVGRFRQFVNAVLHPDGGTGWLPPAGSGKHAHLNGGKGLAIVGGSADAGMVFEPGWLASNDGNLAPTDANLACDATYATWTPTATAGQNEKAPINCVSGYEAYAFCIWDGGFLPSEAEWEYVAAGGSRQREYPWGSAAPGTTDEYAIYACEYPNGTGTCQGEANVAPVGTATLGASAWGNVDLAGDVSELVLDGYAAKYVDPCVDCAYEATGASRVAHGGAFNSPASALSPASRVSSPAASRASTTGFRCARTP